MTDGPVLGKIIEGKAFRDAIHIAVAPVIASHEMHPGDEVGLNSNGEASCGDDANHIGIVDPFLRTIVNKGERFYMFLYPNTVTSLRHSWCHPAFKVKVPGVPHE